MPAAPNSSSIDDADTESIASFIRTLRPLQFFPRSAGTSRWRNASEETLPQGSGLPSAARSSPFPDRPIPFSNATPTNLPPHNSGHFPSAATAGKTRRCEKVSEASHAAVFEYSDEESTAEKRSESAVSEINTSRSLLDVHASIRHSDTSATSYLSTQTSHFTLEEEEEGAISEASSAGRRSDYQPQQGASTSMDGGESRGASNYFSNAYPPTSGADAMHQGNYTSFYPRRYVDLGVMDKAGPSPPPRAVPNNFLSARETEVTSEGSEKDFSAASSSRSSEPSVAETSATTRTSSFDGNQEDGSDPQENEDDVMVKLLQSHLRGAVCELKNAVEDPFLLYSCNATVQETKKVLAALPLPSRHAELEHALASEEGGDAVSCAPAEEVPGWRELIETRNRNSTDILDVHLQVFSAILTALEELLVILPHRSLRGREIPCLREAEEVRKKFDQVIAEERVLRSASSLPFYASEGTADGRESEKTFSPKGESEDALSLESIERTSKVLPLQSRLVSLALKVAPSFAPFGQLQKLLEGKKDLLDNKRKKLNTTQEDYFRLCCELEEVELDVNAEKKRVAEAEVAMNDLCLRTEALREMVNVTRTQAEERTKFIHTLQDALNEREKRLSEEKLRVGQWEMKLQEHFEVWKKLNQCSSS